MFRCAHISDTHIRNLKYHEEYRQVFKEIYDSLIQEQPDYIVHTGDLAHTKTQLSPEYFEMASNFLKSLADIAPTIVILGNHDGNLKNGDRQDAITPIVEALKHPNLTLLKFFEAIIKISARTYISEFYSAGFGLGEYGHTADGSYRLDSPFYELQESGKLFLGYQPAHFTRNR